LPYYTYYIKSLIWSTFENFCSRKAASSPSALAAPAYVVHSLGTCIICSRMHMHAFSQIRLTLARTRHVHCRTTACVSTVTKGAKRVAHREEGCSWYDEQRQGDQNRPHRERGTKNVGPVAATRTQMCYVVPYKQKRPAWRSQGEPQQKTKREELESGRKRVQAGAPSRHTRRSTRVINHARRAALLKN